jgi:hypothetical protein
MTDIYDWMSAKDAAKMHGYINNAFCPMGFAKAGFGMKWLSHCRKTERKSGRELPKD